MQHVVDTLTATGPLVWRLCSTSHHARSTCGLAWYRPPFCNNPSAHACIYQERHCYCWRRETSLRLPEPRRGAAATSFSNCSLSCRRGGNSLQRSVLRLFSAFRVFPSGTTYSPLGHHMHLHTGPRSRTPGQDALTATHEACGAQETAGLSATSKFCKKRCRAALDLEQPSVAHTVDNMH